MRDDALGRRQKATILMKQVYGNVRGYYSHIYFFPLPGYANELRTYLQKTELQSSDWFQADIPKIIAQCFSNMKKEVK